MANTYNIVKNVTTAYSIIIPDYIEAPLLDFARMSGVFNVVATNPAIVTSPSVTMSGAFPDNETTGTLSKIPLTNHWYFARYFTSNGTVYSDASITKINTSSFSNTNAYLPIGYRYRSWIPFKVNLAQATQISVATLYLTAYDTESIDTVNIKIGCENASKWASNVLGMSYSSKTVTLTVDYNAFAVGDKISVLGVNSAFGASNIDSSTNGSWTCKTGTNDSTIIFDTNYSPTGTTPQTVTGGSVTAQYASAHVYPANINGTNGYTDLNSRTLSSAVTTVTSVPTWLSTGVYSFDITAAVQEVLNIPDLTATVIGGGTSFIVPGWNTNYILGVIIDDYTSTPSSSSVTDFTKIRRKASSYNNNGAGNKTGNYAITGMSYSSKTVTLTTANNGLVVGQTIVVTGVNSGFSATNIDGVWTTITGTNSTTVKFVVTSQPTGTTPQTKTVGFIGTPALYIGE